MSDITIKTVGLADAIRFVDNLADWTEDKCTELLDKVTEVGEEVARREFGTALYDGVNDVHVRTERDGLEAYVIAEGDSVAFIEFGAGVHWQAPYPGGTPEGILPIGEYGKGHGKDDYWFYTGQPGTAGGELAHGHPNSTITHGNPPNACLYKASEEMERELPRIAREVFKK